MIHARRYPVTASLDNSKLKIEDNNHLNIAVDEEIEEQEDRYDSSFNSENRMNRNLTTSRGRLGHIFDMRPESPDFSNHFNDDSRQDIKMKRQIGGSAIHSKLRLKQSSRNELVTPTRNWAKQQNHLNTAAAAANSCSPHHLSH